MSHHVVINVHICRIFRAQDGIATNGGKNYHRPREAFEPESTSMIASLVKDPEQRASNLNGIYSMTGNLQASNQHRRGIFNESSLFQHESASLSFIEFGRFSSGSRDSGGVAYVSLAACRCDRPWVTYPHVQPEKMIRVAKCLEDQL